MSMIEPPIGITVRVKLVLLFGIEVVGLDDVAERIRKRHTLPTFTVQPEIRMERLVRVASVFFGGVNDDELLGANGHARGEAPLEPIRNNRR